MDAYDVFDFKRIFVGDRSLVFLLEIVFRTFIMYGYTIWLLRVLGKRGMGQMSNLELAIIIGFGSAVGDPMIGADIPILYGVVCITTITLLQKGMEHVLLRNPRLEKIVDGEPACLVTDGRVDLAALRKDELSIEDLFRHLRIQDVCHLGEVKNVYFETSGEMTVVFHSPRKVKNGLSVLPDDAPIFKDTVAEKAGAFSCASCGSTKSVRVGQHFGVCSYCGNNMWKRSVM